MLCYIIIGTREDFGYGINEGGYKHLNVFVTLCSFNAF